MGFLRRLAVRAVQSAALLLKEPDPPKPEEEWEGDPLPPIIPPTAHAMRTTPSPTLPRVVAPPPSPLRGSIQDRLNRK